MLTSNKIRAIFGHRIVIATLLCTTLVITLLQPISNSIYNKEDKLGINQGLLPGNDKQVLEILKEQYIVPPSSLPYNLSNNDGYLMYSQSASWPYIHYYLEQFFSQKKSGFFVEAGALDGEFLSNTLWLEQALGWKGLLIEPDRESYNKLLKKHRRAWSSNTCLSTNGYPKESVHVAVKLKGQYPSIPWYYRGASHQYGIKIDEKYDSFFELAENSYSVVQCFPLASYLLALNVSTVDFLSLDIQGTEIDVLKSFPWKEITVSVVIVEISNDNPETVNFMENVGYVWLNAKEIDSFEDHIFVRKQDLENFNVKPYSDSRW